MVFLSKSSPVRTRLWGSLDWSCPFQRVIEHLGMKVRLQYGEQRFLEHKHYFENSNFDVSAQDEARLCRGVRGSEDGWFGTSTLCLGDADSK